jgi:adenosylhomocysteine nucleosidase
MKFGIIGAMDLETKLLVEKMEAVTVHLIAGMAFNEGLLNGVHSVVVTSGIGKVNAAACAQILITKFSVSHIINTGVSGGIASELEVGDIVISTDCMEHDFDATGFGYKYGEIPRLEHSVFLADEALINLALASSQRQVKNHKVMKGRIVSGDQFVSTPERKQFLLDYFEAHTTEMEGAAIGHVCYLNNTPFVVIRAMSDKADGSAHVSFDEFAIEAAHNSSHIVMDMLSEIK